MLENLQQDLHDARVLIEQSGTPEEMKRYRKAAEIILVKALHAHPGSEEAKALLQCARALQGGATNAETARAVVAQSPAAMPVAAAVAAVASPQPVAPQPLAFSSSTVSASPVAAKFDDELRFTASVPMFDDSRGKRKKISRLKSMLPFGVIALVMFGGGYRLLRSRAADPAPAYAAPSSSQTQFASRPAVPLSRPAPVSQPEPVPVPPRMQAAAIAVIPTRVVTPAVNVTDRETKPNELTPPPPPPAPARVAVQINAKPWAQVFLDGPVRRSLGQTPLSGVSVPVGAVLLFENPNFPTKSHRIAAADNAIQVEFP